MKTRCMFLYPVSVGKAPDHSLKEMSDASYIFGLDQGRRSASCCPTLRIGGIIDTVGICAANSCSGMRWTMDSTRHFYVK
jgi:hypothetical protein